MTSAATGRPHVPARRLRRADWLPRPSLNSGAGFLSTGDRSRQLAVRVRVPSGGARPATLSEGEPGRRPCGGVTSSLGDARCWGCVSRERGRPRYGAGSGCGARDGEWGPCGAGLWIVGTYGVPRRWECGSRGDMGRPFGAVKAWARFGGRLWLGVGGNGGLAGRRVARGCFLGCSCWTRDEGLAVVAAGGLRA